MDIFPPQEVTCCFTGHRKIPCEKTRELLEGIHEHVIYLIEQCGITWFATGGALGFDTLAAHVILELREQYPQIKLLLILPCPSQDRYFDEVQRATYLQVKNAADKVIYSSQTYHAGCMARRNRALVEHSAYCIGYCTKETGGSFYTLDYARGQGLTCLNLADLIAD